MTYSHVIACPGECPSDRVDRFPADPKVAKLDHAVTGKQDIGRLDITVYYPEFVQVVESPEYLLTGQPTSHR